MATKVYDSKQITLLDGNTIEIVPVKIKYLRELMDEFENIKNAKNDTEAMDVLLRCAFVAMKQYYPQAKTIEDVEDLLDMHMVYDILEYAANIKVNGKNEESKTIKEQTSDTEKGAGWSEKNKPSCDIIK